MCLAALEKSLKFEFQLEISMYIGKLVFPAGGVESERRGLFIREEESNKLWNQKCGIRQVWIIPDTRKLDNLVPMEVL